MRRVLFTGLGALAGLALTISSAAARADGPRYTAATPDEMLDQALARAERGGDDALVGLVLAASLDDRATFGRARDGLARLAKGNTPLADDAKWLGLSLIPAPLGEPWRGGASALFDAPADADGLVKAFAVLGPFHDAGGGLTRREGPEADGQTWGDPRASYAWGAFDVTWRRALPASSTARGLPLDLMIAPRTESCTYLASKVTIPPSLADKSLVVRVASTGAVRVIWDGVDAVSSDVLNPRALLDRLAFEVKPKAGEHLLVLKVCSGALADEGRARARFTDDAHRPLSLVTSSDLSGLRLPDPKSVTVTRVETSLEKGLALGEAPPPPAVDPKKKPSPAKPDAAAKAPSPSPAGALVAAVLRTLGGAEDLRSPRAPGLLDTVAGQADVNADTLAFAGWISPFGSNRSGWLNLARARAGRQNDAATLAFTQRRLAASHILTQHSEWALSLVDAEPLKSANDPEARLLRAMLTTRMGGAGGMRASFDDLTKVAQTMGDAAPTSITQELSHMGGIDYPAASRAMDRLANTVADSRGPSFFRSKETGGAEALEAACRAYLPTTTDAGELVTMGQMLLRAGRLAAASDVLGWAVYMAPNDADAFQLFAATRQAIASNAASVEGPTGENDPRVAAALQRALDLSPTDARLKAEISLRAESEADEEKARETLPDESYMMDKAVFLARAKAEPAVKGSVVDRQLHWLRVVTYHPDKRVSQLMHYSREIVLAPRTQDELYENVPTEGDETELLLARVHRKDGTIVAAEEQSSGGRRGPFIRWPDLQTGDVVEVAVRSWTANPVGRRGDPPFYFRDWVGSSSTRPVLANEVIIDNPEVSPLAVDVIGGKPDRTVVDKKNGRVITRLIWDRAPNVADEPLAPELSETVPLVVGSTFRSWEEFRTWYRGAVEGFTVPDDQIRRLAADLTKGKKTREERIEALFNFVADDIRYVNYVSGEWWLPNRPQELLARRQGDCDDKAMLLITLLKAVGIDATEVLVQTRYTAEPRVLSSTVAAIPLFDHGIAFLPGEKGKPGTWLDATSPQSRLGPLPSMDARARALFVSEGEAKIIEMPSGSPADYGIDATWTMTLGETGEGELVATERHSGDAAFMLRTNLGEEDARAQWVTQYLASFIPAAELLGDVSFRSDLPKGAAELGYRAKSFALARREGNELAVPIAGPSTLTSMLAPLVKRTQPVVLPPDMAPGHDTRTITIVAPKGYVFAELPPGGEEQAGDFGSARVTFNKVAGKADRVTVVRHIAFDLSTIPVDRYEAWRAWLQRVDRLTHQMVRLVPR